MRDPDSAAARAVADRMSDAADAVLAGLDGDRRGTVGRPWTEAADEERRRWFYTPTDHGGLAVADMTAGQYRRTMRLVATGLSEAGYATVTTVMGLENLLDGTEGFAGPDFGRERGRDPGQYQLRIVGSPGDRVWGWRFGGHHVSLNNLVVDGELVSATPCFLGANPATAPLLGSAALRPLGAVEDLARELIRSLDEALRACAVLSPHAPADLVTANRSRVVPGSRVAPGPFRDGRHGPAAAGGDDGATDAAVELTAQPRGVPGSALDPGQRELLLMVLRCYTGRVPEALAEREARRYAESLDEVHVAWAGSVEPGEACYYRLQGPRLLVEYDNSQTAANHAHSVWRDPEGDFGADVLAAHRLVHHAG
ncbi:DUF3500 domain-containing protein [Pseudonocardia nigra]|uniref:DUF3500 domain-containing protein n=1 Tax=Pseudonocardia nigra TaxID=1921578 RepID=UPI001C5D8E02|nr:DUF3500 domain-containing protein [Pseudonocardia nigra]